jgi:tetratricopeptide (TPR) repeat protein
MFDIFGAKDPQKAYQRAQEYIQEGRVDAAIKVLEGNLTDGEESFELYLNLARLYFEVEERTRTVEVLRNALKVVPSRVDEVTDTLSELFFRHASIDLGDYLLQLYIDRKRFEELSKVLRLLSDREIKLLITRYEKLKQNIENKNVISKSDFDNLIVLSTLQFHVGESEKAIESIENMLDVDVYASQLMEWVRTIARERYNDWHASLLMMRAQMVNQDYQGAINQAQRVAEKFPESVDALVALISSAKPPKDIESTYTEFLTDLYIKKGDLNASIELLLGLLKRDNKKIDDVIKGLRELMRINPKNLKILYALGDTYLQANRVSLAITEFDKILEVDRGQYDTVVKKYEEAFKREPNNPQVIESLVKASLNQGKLDEAVSVVETAYRNDPGLLDEYIINLNSILEKDIEKVSALYLLALCYARKGDTDNALVLLESLMEKEEYGIVHKAAEEISKVNPDAPEYLSIRARSMVEVGEEANALALVKNHLKKVPEETAQFIPTLDMIINKTPQVARDVIQLYKKLEKENPFVAQLALARAYAFSGDHETSVKMFEDLFKDEERFETTKRALIEVIKERPKAVPLLLAAARVFMKNGEVEIATQFFKTAQMVDPKAFFEIVDEFYDALKAFPKDREVRTLLVDTFFNRKLWDRVIEESKRAVEVFGRDEAQYFNLRLGEASVESGSLSDAVRPLMLSLDGPEDYSAEVVKYLDKILNIDRSNVPAHFARGRALSRARRVDEAVEEYLLTVRILPARAEYVYEELKTLSAKAMANPLIIFAMGSVELVLKRHEDAIRHLLQACELDITLVKRVIPLYEKIGQSISSPVLDFSLAKAYHLANMKSSAVKHYIKAQTDDKKYREPAIAEMKKICAENPGDIESAKGLAEIYFNYNNLEDSLDLIEQIYKANNRESPWVKKFVSNILKKNPEHIPSYYFLAYIFLHEKSHPKAVDVYKKLLEKSPVEITNVISDIESYKDKSGELSVYLGSLHQETGDIQQALVLFGELFKKDPSFGNAIIYQIKEILKKNSNVGEAYLLAHRIFKHQKEYEKAIEAIHYAKGLLPQSNDIALQEGQTYYDMGEPEKAIKLYTELLDKTKDKKAIYRLIKKTRDQYYKEKVEMIKGDDEDSRLRRADMFLVVGKLTRAEKELQFTPKNRITNKHHSLLRARLCVKRSRPIDALEIMKNYPLDEETAPVYADIYDALGSYEAAARVLRQAGIEGMKKRIASYEKLAQERRMAKGKYFIEGRS